MAILAVASSKCGLALSTQQTSRLRVTKGRVSVPSARARRLFRAASLSRRQTKVKRWRGMFEPRHLDTVQVGPFHLSSAESSGTSCGTFGCQRTCAKPARDEQRKALLRSRWLGHHAESFMHASKKPLDLLLQL
eukprot:4337802-Pleurochrysis_carterae.AAC.4